MTMTLASQYAELLLGLLLKPERHLNLDPEGLSEEQREVLWHVVRKNVILLRLSDCLEKMDVSLGSTFSYAVALERQRIQHTIELIGKITEICSQNGIQFVFTKAFQHYPDMGNDVDLLVLGRSAQVDALITKSLGAFRLKGSLCNWVAGKTAYNINGYPSPLEIHHASIGHIGEHNVFPNSLINNREQVTILGITTFVPCPEDQLIVQVIQRIYGYTYIRLSDVIRTVEIAHQNQLDWEYVVRTTKQVGILTGLCCYMSYIDQIHHSLFGKPFMPPQVRKALILDEWGKVEFRNWYYRFPTVSVIGRVYSRKFLAEVVSGNWEVVGKLCLLPAVTMLTRLRGLTRLGT
jgi:hypothetical protein